MLNEKEAFAKTSQYFDSPGAVKRAGIGGEGSTPNKCQIVTLPPGDANNNLTKCSSKNWNT